MALSDKKKGVPASGVPLYNRSTENCHWRQQWSPHKQQDCAKLIDLALQQLTELLSEGRPQHLSEQRDYNQWPGTPVSLRLREPYAAWREGSHPGLMNIPAVMLKHGREDTVKTLTTLAKNLGKLRGALLIDAIAYHTPSQERQK